MTAVLALGETPETARYLTDDPEAVEAFLVRPSFLVSLLTEALAPWERPLAPTRPWSSRWRRIPRWGIGKNCG
jgi:hypothetical protein